MTMAELHEKYFEKCHDNFEPSELHLGTRAYSEFRRLCREMDQARGVAPFWYENFMNARIVRDSDVEGYYFS